MSSTEDIKSKILAAVKLEELMAETVVFKRQGNRLFGLCPFHEEKSGSLTIFEGRRYYCFGCKASGDAIDFVRKTKGLGYVETLRLLAERCQVDVSDLDRKQQAFDRGNLLSQYYTAMQAANQCFQENLQSAEGAAAMQYLQARGIDSDTIKQFGLGFAKNSFDNLCRVLRQRKVSAEAAEKLSLVRRRGTDDGYFDFFRWRVTIPICDPNGRIIGFGGRDLGDKGPKYLNSAETPLYQKRQSLFGIHLAAPAMRKSKLAYIVEGYMDAIQMWQHGFHETVACLGTALTVEQVRMISAHAQQIYLLFDGDEAGKRASLDALEAALEFPHVQFRCIRLPSREDPDSLLQQGKAEDLRTLIRDAAPLFDFALKAQLQSVEQAGIPALLQTDLLKWISRVQDPVRKGFLIAKTAEFAALPPELIRQAVRSERQAGAEGSQPNNKVAAIAPPFGREAGMQHWQSLQGGTEASSLLPALSRLGYEVLACLFFAKAENVDLTQTRRLIELQFATIPDWEVVALECLRWLEDGQSPCDIDLTHMVCTSHPGILAQLQEFLSRRSAFEVENQQRSFDRLLMHAERSELAKNVDILRRSLASADQAEEQTALLREAMNLTSKIKELDKGLTAL